MYDLRSDTLTQPTSAMRSFMMAAQVGDDVYEADPTIKQLESKAAHLTGFEDALFVLSGTMGNQLAIMCHTAKGDAVLMHTNAHVNRYEVGAISLLSAVYPILVTNDAGYLSGNDIAQYRNKDDIHIPNISCVVLENALGDGRVIDVKTMKIAILRAHANGYRVHIDGARIFNACTALNVSVDAWCRNADSMMFCLSKGLGAPVGSMLCGSKAFIAKARKFRKMLGGGIRQGGFLAAAGIYALENHIVRLKDDHEMANAFAQTLLEFGYEVKMQHRDINMVFFKCKPSIEEQDWIACAKTFGLVIAPSYLGWIRIVTHIDITQAALHQFRSFLAAYEK